LAQGYLKVMVVSGEKFFEKIFLRSQPSLLNSPVIGTPQAACLLKIVVE
jgi:hypothetical protein